MGSCQVNCCAKEDLALKTNLKSEINVHEPIQSD